MTSQATISSGTWTPIVASGPNVTKITVGEFRGAVGFPKGDLLIAKPTAFAQPTQVASGATYAFTKANGIRAFFTGEIVGYVTPAAAITTTLSIDEETAP